MNIYIAAPFKRKGSAKVARVTVETLGHTVTSRWLDLPDDKAYTDDAIKDEAYQDLGDMDAADAVIVLYHPGEGQGMHFEAGYMLGQGKVVVVVGPPLGQFDCLFYRTVVHVPTVMEAVEFLDDLGPQLDLWGV